FRETLDARFGTGMLFTIVSQVITSMLLLTVVNVSF
ncbi:unnamed protein product, partial [marine sediment metagenome]